MSEVPMFAAADKNRIILGWSILFIWQNATEVIGKCIIQHCSSVLYFILRQMTATSILKCLFAVWSLCQRNLFGWSAWYTVAPVRVASWKFTSVHRLDLLFMIQMEQTFQWLPAHTSQSRLFCVNIPLVESAVTSMTVWWIHQPSSWPCAF